MNALVFFWLGQAFPIPCTAPLTFPFDLAIIDTMPIRNLGKSIMEMGNPGRLSCGEVLDRPKSSSPIAVYGQVPVPFQEQSNLTYSMAMKIRL